MESEAPLIVERSLIVVGGCLASYLLGRVIGWYALVLPIVVAVAIVAAAPEGAENDPPAEAGAIVLRVSFAAMVAVGAVHRTTRRR